MTRPPVKRRWIPWLVPRQQPGRNNAWMALDGAPAAVRYCEEQIEYFRHVSRVNEKRWHRCQFWIIAFAAIATLAALIDWPATLVPKWAEGTNFEWLRGVPAAITTVFAGLMAAFNYRGEYVRQAETRDALSGELLKYRTVAEPYDTGTEAERGARLAGNLREIMGTEIRAWRSQQTPDTVHQARSAKPPAPPSP